MKWQRIVRAGAVVVFGWPEEEGTPVTRDFLRYWTRLSGSAMQSGAQHESTRDLPQLSLPCEPGKGQLA